MLKAKDFRYYAREALQGRWLKAGAVAFVAGLLGASIDLGNVISFSGSTGGGSESGVEIDTGSVGLSGMQVDTAQVQSILIVVLLGVLLIALIMGIVMLVVGGATTLGYAKYNLNLVDDRNPRLQNILSQYDRLGTGFAMQFFRMLFIFLWSLLLFIPGIIAQYRYYMTPYILCENPEMTAWEAIKESKRLMKGNKWRLFCLLFSFVGWGLLAIFAAVVPMLFFAFGMVISGVETMRVITLIVLIVYIFMLLLIGAAVKLFLSPYITAATAVFYREITEGRYSQPQVEAEGFVEEVM